MPLWSWVMVGLTAIVTFGALTEGSPFLFPQVTGYGGIVQLPNAAEPPRRGTKIIFDITVDTKPEELNKGLESVARYLNLNADAGFRTADVKLAVVLHGPATKTSLGDAAYASRNDTKNNPNSELIHKLKECGVEIFVCGQSLARNKFALTEVDSEVTVAVSAMTVIANKQQDGYSYLSIH